jgi:lipopolysaccharide/colanic/teichoic acid biosynthesis glycosyltransferase
MKRIFDVAASAAAIVVLLPLLLAIALLVWIDAGRPIFFGHERVGRNFRRFRLWKFRSMRPSADGPQITVGGDSRITRSGRLLRLTKLDELPQLWNVLRGDMSLVGPRPEVSPYVDLYHDRYASILAVRPGITDLASVVYRHEESILSAQQDPERYYRDVVLPAKLNLADEYIGRQCLALDAQILVRTVVAALHL